MRSVEPPVSRYRADELTPSYSAASFIASFDSKTVNVHTRSHSTCLSRSLCSSITLASQIVSDLP